MTLQMSVAEKKLIKGFRSISPKARRHVLRLVEALEGGLNPEDAEFTLWFDQLAHRRGFESLTYKDILKAVRRVRHDT